MVDFAGWEMPLMYRSIVEEHEQTRRSGSIFDVSHMGRLHFTGPEAAAFLNKALTRKISDQAVGQSRYSLVCNEAGGVLDDVIVSRDAKYYLVVCNASNRQKLVQHFLALRRQTGMDFDLADQTQSTAMIALQGPKVIERLSQALSTDLSTIKRYHFTTLSMMGMVKLSVFRSGYTGEDGVEIILAAKVASMAISMLNGRADKPNATLKAAGLGARDTLRLEAGMPLYGHELTEATDPLSAGLGWAVDLTKDFVAPAPCDPATKRPDAQTGGLGIARPAHRPPRHARPRRCPDASAPSPAAPSAPPWARASPWLTWTSITAPSAPP